MLGFMLPTISPGGGAAEGGLTKAAVEPFRQFGIDVEAFREGLEEHCPEPQEQP